MIAEYVAIAGAPLPDTPWPLVLDIAQRGPQFEARRHLTMFGAVQSAISTALGGDEGAGERERLRAVAYPTHGEKPRAPGGFLPNMFEVSGG